MLRALCQRLRKAHASHASPHKYAVALASLHARELSKHAQAPRLTSPAPLPTSRKKESPVSVYGGGRVDKHPRILSFPPAVYVAYAAGRNEPRSSAQPPQGTGER